MKPSRQWLERLVRQFPENGLKLLLEETGNVRELLQILEVKLLDRIDFAQMKVEPARFVQRDFRHLESDVVLSAPLRLTAEGLRRQLIVYILIEHQSKPDEFMIFRVLEYVTLIYKRQMRDWQRKHDTLEGFRFQPVLPIVLYSGNRTWEKLGSIKDLVELGDELADLIPALVPMFLNVGKTDPDQLESKGGAFGHVLRLVQQKNRRARVFGETLTKVVQALRGLAESEVDRWHGLLSYIHALVYYERSGAEHPRFHQQIEDAVQDIDDEDVPVTGKTIREMFIDQGIEKGRKEEAVQARRQVLVRLLKNRFGRIPIKQVRRIEATTDLTRLNAWLDAVVTAQTLDDLGILSAN
jgi:hypothetical protein